MKKEAEKDAFMVFDIAKRYNFAGEENKTVIILQKAFQKESYKQNQITTNEKCN